MKAVVWSKNGCPYCVEAKALLQSKGVEIEERNLTEGKWTKQQLLVDFPSATTVPQIILDGDKIGTFQDLKQYYEKDTQ